MNLLAAIAVATVFDIAPERLRDAVATFAAGKMRGERTEHNGIVIWNDCYNSNPEAAQSMIDVLRDTPAARRIAVLGEMLELGHAADELHRAGGPLRRRAWGRPADRRTRRGARHGGSGARTRAAGRAFLRRSGRSRRARPRTRAAGRRRPLQGLARRASGEGAGKVLRLRSHALLSPLRTASPVHKPVPRFLVHHRPHRLREPDRVVPVHRARPVADQQAAPVSNRPIHPRRRSQIAPEEGRHADHGRRPHHHLHRHPDAALGRPALSLRVDRARRADRLRLDRLPGRLRQGHQAAQSGPLRQAQARLPVPRGLRLRGLAAGDARVRRFLHRDEHPVHQAVQTLAAVPVADVESVDLRRRCRALLHFRRAGGGLLLQRCQSDRWSGWPRHRADGDRRRRPDRAGLRRRSRATSPSTCNWRAIRAPASSPSSAAP